MSLFKHVKRDFLFQTGSIKAAVSGFVRQLRRLLPTLPSLATGLSTVPSSLPSAIGVVMLLLWPNMVNAEGPAPGPSSSSYISVLASLFLVLAIMLGLALVYKRLNIGLAGTQGIKVVTSLALGTKERLLVIELNGKQHLIGVTAAQISHLITLDEPLNKSAGLVAGDLSAQAQPNQQQKPLSAFEKILQGVKKNHE